MKKILLTCVLLLFINPVFAADIVIEWDANTESNIDYYNVYYGTEHGVYNAPVDVGNVLGYTIVGLNAGTYYITVTAVDTGDNESEFSYEVVKKLKVSMVTGIALP